MPPVSNMKDEQISELARFGYASALFIATALLTLVLVVASGPIFYASTREWEGLGMLWSLCLPAYLFMSHKVGYKYTKYFEAESFQNSLLSFIGNMLFVAISGFAITVAVFSIPRLFS